MLLNESPEKQPNLTKEHLDTTTKGANDTVNKAFSESHNKEAGDDQNTDMKPYMDFIKDNTGAPSAAIVAGGQAHSSSTQQGGH